jgi:hypothetical protein
MCAGQSSFAQTEEEDDSEVETHTVIDQAPIGSARADAMGGAISPIADDLDATFHNPAGIGGVGMGKTKMPWVRKLYFPHLSASANKNTQNLNEAFKEQGGTDPANGQAIVDAEAGARQYARATFVSGLVLGRTILVPFNDYQMAAVSQGDDQIDTHYRSASGVGAGFSVTDEKNTFSLGYFGYTMAVKDMQGSLNYLDLIDTELRKEAMSANTSKYSGAGHNAGMSWRLAKKGAPTLAVVMKNIGDTVLKKTGGPEESTADTADPDDPDAPLTTTEGFEIPENLTYKSDLTVGFGVSPSVGKSGNFHWVLEAGNINNSEVAIAEKFRTGMEYSLWGGTGSYAALALRAGYNHAGPSGGVFLNMGLIYLEASSYSVDIGVDNEKVVEQRATATFGINVGDF